MGQERDDLDRTTHDDLVRDQLAHPPLGSMRLRDAGTPVRAGVSGSGDSLLVLTWSAAELERERQAGVRLFARLGLKRGSRVANALPGALATPGSLLLGDVVQDLGGLDVPVGAVDGEAAAKAAWTLIDMVEPEALVLNAASATHLFSTAPSQARPWLKGIVWLRIDRLPETVPSVPEAVGFQGWQRTWLAVPEATSFVAMTCAEDRFHADVEASIAVFGDTLAVSARGMESGLKWYASELRGHLVEGGCGCGTEGAVFRLDANRG